MVPRLVLAALAALLLVAILAAFSGIRGGTEDLALGPQGQVQVIDADTFDVGEIRVRLHGVDAPESNQTCLDAQGRAWACGAWAIEQARARWDGRRATCERLDIDRYGREVARCEVGGEDVGAVLVSGGMALAYRDYSDDYIVEEAEAQAARAGLWQGEFQRPQDYRRSPITLDEITDVVAISAPEGCDIKGNISGSGRIYHHPGSRHYEATTIDEGQGERWFCSAEEAEGAGWRAAR